MPDEIVHWRADGTPTSARFGDIYRRAGADGQGGLVQARQVFLRGCHLLPEGDTRAARSFEYALEVEKVHAALYSAASENLGRETGEYDYYVCPVCGYTHARTAPDKCPVCGLPGAKFEVVH